jgi:hypothetical protein
MNKMMIYLQSRKTAPMSTGDRSRGDTPADAVSLLSAIERIKYLASLEPTELAKKMDADEGASLGQVETEPVELKSLLRPWNAIRRASPGQLTDEQYDAFLKGEHPITDAGELYGAHLQSDT